jgi:hypothetical protein
MFHNFVTKCPKIHCAQGEQTAAGEFKNVPSPEQLARIDLIFDEV